MSLLLALTSGGGGAANYTLSCSAGVYNLSGKTTALKTDRALSLAAGSYSSAGVAANLKTARALVLASGTYGYAGVSQTQRIARKLPLSPGVYSYVGATATLTYTPGSVTPTNYTLACAPGAYSYSGAVSRVTLGAEMIIGTTPADVWNETLESGYSARQIMRLMAAVLAGKVSGAGTATVTFAGLDGTTPRIVGTVDASGNRTAVIVDGSP